MQDQHVMELVHHRRLLHLGTMAHPFSAYAGTVISIFLVVMLIELFRRLAREYDRKIVREHAHAQRSAAASVAAADRDDASAHKLKDGSGSGSGSYDACAIAPFRPTMAQQSIRSFFYFVQFSAGYMLMLMAMYYNGGIILAIFFGSYFGFFVSSGNGSGIRSEG
ncbi:hypothetical protein D9615_009405 [Tricholomella constricta]|uniref:Copper transport protein n=1 Tax=Tricholomella constricta TaxID=117010 RepID=A0A8H5H2V8_9AGAR|nr:hypothetical protein D9615_009405 [Tricholomella constricta]